MYKSFVCDYFDRIRISARVLIRLYSIYLPFASLSTPLLPRNRSLLTTTTHRCLYYCMLLAHFISKSIYIVFCWIKSGYLHWRDRVDPRVVAECCYPHAAGDQGDDKKTVLSRLPSFRVSGRRSRYPLWSRVDHKNTNNNMPPLIIVTSRY